jgi:hypothetical protein
VRAVYNTEVISRSCFTDGAACATRGATVTSGGTPTVAYNGTDEYDA